ncbi:MAG TPA: anhydro-N-acetylmuramic acid kinase [Phycisphaerales bacterium]|nr:anhydro-N-acetylmuramic acid kinase [Phycisphaerales bacterium]
MTTGPRVVVGCMTGTSLDALDAAAVRISGMGLGADVELIAAGSWALGDLAWPLREVAEQKAMASGEIAALALRFGTFHAGCLGELVRSRAIAANLIAVHGQTVFHRPPVSWQMINPAPIAHALGVPVVFDLRQADLAAGGQGAPITPIADAVLFRAAGDDFAVVNLGGFCNVTIVRGAGSGSLRVEGRDVCACNHVLDAAARVGLGVAYDKDGGAAMRGVADERAVAALKNVLFAQGKEARSLGTGDEAMRWTAEFGAKLRGADLAASACAAVGGVIADVVRGSTRVILAGGGVKNAALVGAIRGAARTPVVVSNDFGVPVDQREAMAMAVLGDLCRQRVPITLPGVTGCREPAPVAGYWVLP